MTAEILFWIFAAIVLYTYAGYGLLLYLLTAFSKKTTAISKGDQLPSVTLLIAAYNEAVILRDKIENSLQLDYPRELLHIVIVTDGSTDASPSIASSYSSVTCHHQQERRGKSAALNRIMPGITTEITVFTDANTMLNTHAIRDLVKHFQHPVVGVAAGEKRVVSEEKDGIASKSEGIYWKYESFLKSMDSRLHSVIGAAGELYAIRTNLYPDVDPKVIIEDFYISMRIAMGGKVIRYAPDAYAMEKGSISISEEMKRKVRIAAGGLQVILLLYPLLNIFRYGWLSFQYISHRVLRWTLAPLGLLVIFLCSMSLGLMGNTFYLLLFLLQVVFYLLAIAGWILSKRSIKVKMLYLPFYFSMMNYAVYVAFFSLLRGKKFEVWEKAERVS